MSNNPYAAAGAEGAINPQAAKGKLTPVGICLIIVGVLSILFGAYMGFSGFATLMIDPDQLLEQMKENDPAGMEQMAEQGIDPSQWFQAAGVSIAIWGILNFLCGLIVVWGGVCCLRVKGRMMAMIASILAVIPIFQCCLGIPFGIWGIVVLMAPDVKAAFEANS